MFWSTCDSPFCLYLFAPCGASVPTGIRSHLLIHATQKAHCCRPFTALGMAVRLSALRTPARQETLKTLCAVLIPQKTQLLPMLDHQQRFSWDFGRAVGTFPHGVPLQASYDFFPLMSLGKAHRGSRLRSPVITVWL